MADVSDVIVVGGGVVGCAIIWELTSRGYECLLLEKNENLVSEASSGNRFSKLTDVLKVSKLPIIAEKSRAAGISSASEISLSELYRREPGLSRHAQGALWIPEETVVDPWLTAISLVHDARRKGAVVKTDTVVQNTCKADHNQYVHVMTSRGQFTGRVVINCGGLYGDIVDKLAGLQHFSIVPKKGQYAVYPKTVKHLINSSILPIPTDKGKGEIIFKTVYGNVIIGPTFEEAISKRRPESDSNTIQRLIRYGESCVKGLGGCPIVNTYTGVRPATEIKDYYIDSYPESGWITVGGIRSTGLSGSLGIADKVRKLVLCQHNLEPSRAKGIELNKMAIKFLPPGHAMIDDVIYTVTHPITLCGMDTPMESHL